jgi:hypothetical protein
MTKRFWFQFTLWMCITATLLGLLLAAPAQSFIHAQDAATSTITPGGPQAFITVLDVGEPAINVRTGPSTAYYPVIGQLPIGATAPALGKSPSSTWIEIAYASGPGGVGWVYAANVTLTGSPPIVEPPPTETPVATQTIDPTLAAAFNVQPTATRLPTFTPPAPLVVPTFSDKPFDAGGFPLGIVIAGSTLLGLFVLLASFFGRR